jgi:hypothetical protein
VQCRNRTFGMFLVGLSFVGATIPAAACTVCITYPRKTVADLLIESPCVVFARENPDQPFSYAPVEILKGNIDGKQIDLFVDSGTRRILATDPARVVVLVQEATDGGWRSLGLADSAYAAVARRIIAFSPEWQSVEGERHRVDFFVTLFGHDNPSLYELAYLELARAPYADIQRVSRAISREQIEPVLERRQYIVWRSLAILMLANRGEAKDREYIAESFCSAAQFGLTTNLAAWAAASIELEGEDAISFIETQYFRNSNRTLQELTQVVKALTLHGTEGHTHLRGRINASYAVLREVHPDMAALVPTVGVVSAPRERQALGRRPDPQE